MSEKNLPNAAEVELEVTNEIKFMLPGIRVTAIVVGLLVLVGAGFSKYMASEREAKALAQEELAVAGIEVALLKKIVDNEDYSDELRASACLRMATAQFEKANYEDAAKSFKTITADFAKTTSVIKAMFGQAKCLESDTTTVKDAIAIYTAIGEKSDNDKAVALYSAARCYKLAAQVKEAKKLYTQVVQMAGDDSPFKMMAQEQLLNINAVDAPVAVTPLAPLNMEKVGPAAPSIAPTTPKAE